MSTKVTRRSSEILDLVRHDGHWRWRYLDEAEGVELLSNEEYEDVASARRSASIAYPEVPFSDSPDALRREAVVEEGGSKLPYIVTALLCLLIVGLLIAILRS